MGVVDREGGGGHPIESLEWQLKEFRIHSPERHDGPEAVFEMGISGISFSELAHL